MPTIAQKSSSSTARSRLAGNLRLVPSPVLVASVPLVAAKSVNKPVASVAVPVASQPAPALVAPVPLVAAKPGAQPVSRLTLPVSAPPVAMNPALNLPFLKKVPEKVIVLRHGGIGVALEVMDGVRSFLAPAKFCLSHARWVSLGLLTFTLPPLVALGLWSNIPGWSEGFPLTGVLSWGFLGGLTVAIGFVAAVFTVVLRSVGTALLLAGRYLTRKGREAF